VPLIAERQKDMILLLSFSNMSHKSG